MEVKIISKEDEKIILSKLIVMLHLFVDNFKDKMIFINLMENLIKSLI